MAAPAAHARRDHRPGTHRDGRRQRRRRCVHLCAGRPGFRLLAPLDPDIADPGPHRQPGDGCAVGRGHRGRLREAHQRAVRPLLGLVLGRGNLPPQLPDHQHGVHGHQPRRRVLPIEPRACGADRGRASHRHHGQRQLPALGASNVRVPLREPSRSTVGGPQPS